MSAEGIRRVVITGLGVIAPNGSDIGTFWQSIVAGRSAAGPLTRFDALDSPVQIACEVRDFSATDFIDAKAAKRLDRSIHFSVAAAMKALKDSGVKIGDIDATRVGSVEGTSVAHLGAAAKAESAYQLRGFKGISMFQMLNGYTGGGSSEVATELGIKGHAVTLSSGSASGNDVMGYAAMMIRDDEADVMVVGGAEAPIQPLVWGAFCQSRVMTRATGDPAAAMKRFRPRRGSRICGDGGTRPRSLSQCAHLCRGRQPWPGMRSLPSRRARAKRCRGHGCHPVRPEAEPDADLGRGLYQLPRNSDRAGRPR
jgi:3-oxoacyl-[acyl-carrier-protein] synthase II